MDDDDTQVKKTSRTCVQTYPCFCLSELFSVVTNAPGILRVLVVRRVADTAQMTSDCGKEHLEWSQTNSNCDSNRTFWILLELRMLEVVVTAGAIRRAELR